MYRKYWERNISVIPVYGKRSILNNWSQYCTRMPTEEEIDLWEEKYPYPTYGIAVCLGPVNNLVAWDCDVEEDEIKDLCPPSPIKKYGSKGFTAFFRPGDGITSTSKPGFIDILYNGRITILPPSVHPTTKEPYKWLTLDTLENFDIEDLPILDVSYVNSAFNKLSSEPKHMEQEGRNNTLTKVSCAMICDAPYKDDETIANELLEYDIKHHSSPYFSDRSEIENKKSNGNSHNAALLFVQRQRKQLEKKGMLTKINNYISFNSVETPKEPENKFPNVGGIIEIFRDQILKCSRSEQESMAFGSALSLAAVLSSNRFSVDSRPLYTHSLHLLVGSTSSGKGASMDFIASLLSPQNLGGKLGYNLLGIRNYSSDIAIISMLEKQRTRIDVIDEFGQVFKGLASKGDRKSSVGDVLKILFSSKESFSGHYTKTNGLEGKCIYPALSILGAIQPETLLTYTNQEILFDGLLGRFLYFFEDENAPWTGGQFKNGVSDKDMELLIESCLFVYPQAPLIDRDFFGNFIEKECMQEIKRNSISIEDNASKYLMDIDNEHYAYLSSLKRNDEKVLAALQGRAIEHIYKIAFLIAISNNERIVKIDHIDLAKEVVNVSMNQSKQTLLVSGSGKYEKDLLKIIGRIKKEPNRSIEKRMLLRNLNFSSKTLGEYISTLIERGEISVNEDKNRKIIIRLV